MKKIIEKLDAFSDYLLISVIAIIIAATLLDSVHLLLQLKTFFNTSDATNFYSEFLGKALSLVIGLEFIRMLTHHSPDLVIEVLIYAISRNLIVSHPDFTSILLGILAIAILFAIRKFFLIRGVDISPENMPHSPDSCSDDHR